MDSLKGWFQSLLKKIRGPSLDDMGAVQNSVESAPASPAALAPSASQLLGDAEIQGLIERRRNGDKLSPAENGKLGAYAARTGTKLPGRPKAVAAVAAGVDTGAGQTVSAPGGPLPDAVADSCKAVCATLLQAADELKAMTVGAQLSKIGIFSDAEEKAFLERAKMPASTKTVLVESSPAVVASLNIPPEKFPVGAFCSVIAIEGTRFAMLMKELRDLAKEYHKNPEPKKNESGG